MSAADATPVHVSFTAGDTGDWRIDAVVPVAGATLPTARRLAVGTVAVDAAAAGRGEAPAWRLTGFTSNPRYTTRAEQGPLKAGSAPLARPTARAAAMIAIRKTPAWWALAQDERRAIFEDQSHHIEIGRDYLPAIARRLHHSRDLGQPFDFLTWFEFAPSDATAFDDMLARLRATPEWAYVDREVDVRLRRAP